MTEVNTKKEIIQTAETTMEPHCDINSPRCKHLIEKAICIFKDKLTRCGYNDNDIECILSKSQEIVEEKIAARGFAILWTIDLRESRLKKQPIYVVPTKRAVKPYKSLIDVFTKLKLDIKPLGYYELLVDYNRGIFVSEKRGVHPSKVC